MSEDQYNILFGTHKPHIYSGGSCKSVSLTQDRGSSAVAYLRWLEHACRLFEIGWFHTLRFLELKSRAHDNFLQFKCQKFFSDIVEKDPKEETLRDQYDWPDICLTFSARVGLGLEGCRP